MMDSQGGVITRSMQLAEIVLTFQPDTVHSEELWFLVDRLNAFAAHLLHAEC